MAKDLKFPIGYGVDKDTSDNLGGYWETRRNFAQPSEFLITPSGKMAQVSYSDGPLARTEAGDVIKLVGFLESQKKNRAVVTVIDATKKERMSSFGR